MSDFDERFKSPEWLKDKLTDEHMPIASKKDIKSFILSDRIKTLEMLIKNGKWVEMYDIKHFVINGKFISDIQASLQELTKAKKLL